VDAATAASLATAGGTLVLAVATFSSTRSANRAARVSEQALRVGVRPVLFNTRPQDPPQKVGFIDGHWQVLRDGLSAVQEHDGNLYLSIGLRNVGAGLAVLDGWYLWPHRARNDELPARLDEFNRLTRDLYIANADIGFWQTALRDPQDPLYGPVRDAIVGRTAMSVDILYGDHEGGQRTITRFAVLPRQGQDDGDDSLWTCAVARHWNLDRDDPR
jgi:hypothetical protein